MASNSGEPIDYNAVETGDRSAPVLRRNFYPHERPGRKNRPSVDRNNRDRAPYRSNHHRSASRAAPRFLRSGHRGQAPKWLTVLRALLRGNEFYLIPLSLLVGVIAGAIVTLMSQIAQIAHVLIYGIPIDVRLSANAYVNPVVALVAPALGGLSLGIMEWSRRRLKISNAVDPIEANALRGGRLSARDSVVVSGQTLVSNGCGASATSTSCCCRR